MSLLNNMIPQRFLLVFHNEHGKACAVTSDNCILEDPGEYYESQAVCKWEIVGGPAYLKVNRFHIGEDDTLTIYDGKEDRTAFIMARTVVRTVSSSAMGQNSFDDLMVAKRSLRWEEAFGYVLPRPLEVNHSLLHYGADPENQAAVTLLSVSCAYSEEQ